MEWLKMEKSGNQENNQPPSSLAPLAFTNSGLFVFVYFLFQLNPLLRQLPLKNLHQPFLKLTL